jgi:hypothetical protein
VSAGHHRLSTPLPLALVASTAAAITPADHVLEPSAGTGLLAVFAELAGGSLALNELAETRAGLLGHLFPEVGVTRFDAAHIDDHLDPGVTFLVRAHEKGGCGVPAQEPATAQSASTPAQDDLFGGSEC